MRHCRVDCSRVNASIYALSLETVDSPPGLSFLLFGGKGSVAFGETRVCQTFASGNLEQIESPTSTAVYEMKTSIILVNWIG